MRNRVPDADEDIHNLSEWLVHRWVLARVGGRLRGWSRWRWWSTYRWVLLNVKESTEPEQGVPDALHNIEFPKHLKSFKNIKSFMKLMT